MQNSYQKPIVNLSQTKLMPPLTLNFNQLKFYIVILIFVTLSVLTPAFLHTFSIGGRIVLPLYFFVLIAGYQFGWKAGVLTALLSPILSNLISGMPTEFILILVILKSIILGFSAGIIAKTLKQISFKGIFLSILIYQILGLIIEFLLSGQINLFISDITVGYPGLLIQLFGGYFGLKLIKNI